MLDIIKYIQDMDNMDNMRVIALSNEEINLILRAMLDYEMRLEDRNLDIELNGNEANLNWLINENNAEIVKLKILRDILLTY